MLERTVGVGVIGCGVISQIYLRNLTKTFRNVEVVAVADAVQGRAKQRAEEFAVPIVCRNNEELFAREDVEIIVNLTVPTEHVGVSMAALEAGKHVFTEKPLAMTRESGRELVALAEDRGLLLACAPDTVLGASMQMCRKLISDGWIGKPFAAIGHGLRSGPESWHPEPAFLYQKGAGPLFDTGPYFVTAMAYLLGPVESVSCSAVAPWAERVITSARHFGEKIAVEVPTTVAMHLGFVSGAMASIVISNDIGSSRQHDARQHNQGIEVYGSEGTLAVPSPSFFDGQIYYKREGMEGWCEVPSLFCYGGDARGLGVAEVAGAVRLGRRPRINAEMAYHTLDVLVGLDVSLQGSGREVVRSSFDVPAPLSPRVVVGEVEDPGEGDAPLDGFVWPPRRPVVAESGREA